MPGVNNYNNYGSGTNSYGMNWNGGGYGNSVNGNGMFGLSPQQIIQYFQQGRLEWSDFVHGRAGAEAYPLPPGVTMAKLWDDETDRFYIKGYDNNGRPRVLADNDFQGHIDPEPVQQPQLDLSAYATKDDIRTMIGDALSTIHTPNLSGYVTQGQFNKALSELSVGNGGRIVRQSEPNA